jgi:AcrR family transcriptional regulator
LSRPSRNSKTSSGRRSLRSAERRETILRAARTLVAQVGFRDAQMVAVAARAGVALGTLYRYFPSKAELMVEVVALVAQHEMDAVAAVAAAKECSADRLLASAWTFATRAFRGQRMAHALIAEAVEPEVDRARLNERRNFARILETIIEQGISEREFPTQDARAAAACIVGSLFEGLIGPLALESPATSEERLDQARAIVRFCMRGVSGSNASIELDEDAAGGLSRGRAKRR